MIGFAAASALHGAALVTSYITEYSLFAFALAALTWGLLNCLFLVLLRRPGISAALSLAFISFVILMSQFKFGITWMTLTFLDVLVIDSDTFYFLVQIFPILKLWLIAGAIVLVPVALLIWWIDPFRVPRPMALVGALMCVAGIVPLSLAFPEEGYEPFQGINHISNFSRSGVHAISQLLAKG